MPAGLSGSAAKADGQRAVGRLAVGAGADRDVELGVEVDRVGEARVEGDDIAALAFAAQRLARQLDEAAQRTRWAGCRWRRGCRSSSDWPVVSLIA